MAHVNKKTLDRLADGRVRLTGPSGQSKTGIFLMVFALIWNAFTWPMFILFAANDDGFSWTYLFFAPFLLVGVGTLIGAVVLIIQGVLAGRRLGPVVLTLPRLPLRLGEHFDVEFEQTVKSACEIERVTLTLKCEEWVRYTVGTDTRTAKHTAYETKCEVMGASSVGGSDSLAGSAPFSIPIDAMQTFDARNNKIKWTLFARSAIANWPDYTVEIPIAVCPIIAPDVPEGSAPVPVEFETGHDRPDGEKA